MEKAILAISTILSGIVSVVGINSIKSSTMTVRDYCINNGRILIYSPVWGEMDSEDLKEIISQTPDSDWPAFTEGSNEDSKIQQLTKKCEELFNKTKAENDWEKNIKIAEKWCSIED